MNELKEKFKLINQILDKYESIIKIWGKDYDKLFRIYSTINQKIRFKVEEMRISCNSKILRIRTILSEFENFLNDNNYNSLSEQFRNIFETDILNIDSSYNVKDIESYTNDDIGIIKNILKDNKRSFSDDEFNRLSYFLNISDDMINVLHHILFILNKDCILLKISTIENNIVMIGANGSGKSTFSRQFSRTVDSGVTIIQAQHILYTNESNNIQVSEDYINKVRYYQNLDKLGNDNNFVYNLTSDFDNLLLALCKESIEVKTKFYDEFLTSQERKISLLDKTIAIWEKLISHRKLVPILQDYKITVQTLDGSISYPFNNLSDGEKIAFYYIGHVLLAKDNSYIIVDEPENHLNPSICNKLWDALEKERRDCKFVYLTHNIDFAVARNNKTIIWNKQFLGAENWDFNIIQDDMDLPEELLIELLGSKKPILFCEGEKSSYDYKIYSIIFPEFTVIPVKGHLDVVNFCKVYNRNKSFYGNSAFGIIDKDVHSDEEIASWKKDGVFLLPFNEIENFLCCSLILDSAGKHFYSEDKIPKIKQNIIEIFEKRKEEQLSWYLAAKINNIIKIKNISESKKVQNVINSYNNMIASINTDEIISNKDNELQAIINKKDFDETIKEFNLKGELFKDLNNIINDYPVKVIKMISEDDNLKNELRKQYFGFFEDSSKE